MVDMSRLGRKMAGAVSASAPSASSVSRREATVSGVNSDGTLDVDLGGDGSRVLSGVKAVESCNARVGDRVILDTVGHVCVVIASLSSKRYPATLYDNGYWRVIDHGGTLSCTARNVKTGSGSWDVVECKYTVPAELRPATECLAACCTQSGDSGAGFIRVKPDGKISMGQLGNAGTSEPRFGQVIWVPGI